MSKLLHTERLPANFNEFVEEVAAGLGAMYGDEAGRHYRAIAAETVLNALRHPSVDGIVSVDEPGETGETASGMIMSVSRGPVTYISFIHVLRRFSGRDIERALISEAVGTARAAGASGIVAECTAFTPLRLEGVFSALGFDTVERQLMLAPLDSRGPAFTQPCSSRPCARTEFDDVAEAIIDAYRNEPDRRLHIEVRDRHHAHVFLKSVSSGSWGTFNPEYIRAIWRDGTCAAAIVGCETMPSLGFIIQLAVRPAYRRRGFGLSLVRDLAHVFGVSGLAKMSLGVTRSSGARRLYERLGFERLRPVNAYVWWADAFDN